MTINRDIQNLLPEDVWIEEILLKLPVSSLSNLSYVCKFFLDLITKPSFIKLHLHHSTAKPNNHLLLVSSHQVVHSYMEDPRIIHYQNFIHNYTCYFPTTKTEIPILSSPEIVKMNTPFKNTEIQASCNGLLYLHRKMINGPSRKYIWNPITKQIIELPSFPPDPPSSMDMRNGHYSGLDLYSSSGFCGFGYDSTNDKYKILYYEHTGIQKRDNSDGVLVFKLHTVAAERATISWKIIEDNPYKSYYFFEPFERIGLLVNGSLHWIMCLSYPKPTKIISFDMEKEVVREIPKPVFDYKDDEMEVPGAQLKCLERLQVLQECLCICQVVAIGRSLEFDIWMLQDYNVMGDSWTKLFKIVFPNKHMFDYYELRLLRYCENGEIVMLRDVEDVCVYDPVNKKSRRLKKFNQNIPRNWMYYLDYTESLVWIS